MMKYEFSKTCSFERDISDTSMEHDAVSTRLYPKKLIAYIRGDYKNQWWTSYFGVHEKLRTAQTDREGDALLDYLTSEMFPDLDTLIAFCESNGKDFQGVWLYVECDLCNYAVRIIPMKNNYNLYLYQYIK
ncbi:MAG: hypothetical protein UIH27_00675 [Ruminococcus sp.]|nr:hypothetical protein [Ruminococcus sp.]